MITEQLPADWRDLEAQCARILRECGFDVTQPRVVETVRGTVELDVYAEEEIEGRKYSIACECKHWTTRVPQREIHAFRAVLADLGTNAGYLISSAGFQEGAFAAVVNTNIQLVTWRGFQEAFEESWYRSYLAPTLEDRLGGLMTLVEPLPPTWIGWLTEAEREAFGRLRTLHSSFGFLLLSFVSPILLPRHAELPELPLSARETGTDHLGPVPEAVTHAPGYREFLDAVTQYGGEVLAELRTYRDRALERQKSVEG